MELKGVAPQDQGSSNVGRAHPTNLHKGAQMFFELAHRIYAAFVSNYAYFELLLLFDVIKDVKILTSTSLKHTTAIARKLFRKFGLAGKGLQIYPTTLVPSLS